MGAMGVQDGLQSRFAKDRYSQLMLAGSALVAGSGTDITPWINVSGATIPIRIDEIAISVSGVDPGIAHPYRIIRATAQPLITSSGGLLIDSDLLLRPLAVLNEVGVNGSGIAGAQASGSKLWFVAKTAGTYTIDVYYDIV